MAIELREFIGELPSVTNVGPTNKYKPKSLNEGFSYNTPISKNSIMQDIEGIHVGPTRNFTWYTESALQSSVESWTKPYNKPLIMHHNETDGKTIGRVCSVEYITKNTRSNTPALMFTCNIADKDGKEQVMDGRLNTVSIGVIAHDVTCSICGEQIEIDEYGESSCGHSRGAVYGDKVCYWMVNKMEAKELSYVIVPSDIYAHNIRTYSPIDNKTISSQEKMNDKSKINLSEGAINMPNMNVETNDIKEATKIDEANGEFSNVDASTTIEPATTENEKENNEEAKTEEPKENEANEDVIAENEKLKAEIEEHKAKILEAQKSVLALQKEVERLSNTLKEEADLRKNAENEVVAAQTEAREAIEDSLNSLRKIADKEAISKEDLAIRTKESLLDSIRDLKEELSNSKKTITIQEANDPTLKKNPELKENANSECVKDNANKGNNFNEAICVDDIYKMFNM